MILPRAIWPLAAALSDAAHSVCNDMLLAKVININLQHYAYSPRDHFIGRQASKARLAERFQPPRRRFRIKKAAARHDGHNVCLLQPPARL